MAKNFAILWKISDFYKKKFKIFKNRKIWIKTQKYGQKIENMDIKYGHDENMDGIWKYGHKLKINSKRSIDCMYLCIPFGSQFFFNSQILIFFFSGMAFMAPIVCKQADQASAGTDER